MGIIHRNLEAYIRTKKISTPIIGLSEGGVMMWPEYRALFLENGGDDLLRLPVNPRELIATISAIDRRINSNNLSEIIIIEFAGIKIKINIPAANVTINGENFHLTMSEYKLFVALVRANGRALSKERLLSLMYIDGVEEVPEIKIVDVFVCKVRKKLSRCYPGMDGLIKTLWGRGYVFDTRDIDLSQDKAIA